MRGGGGAPLFLLGRAEGCFRSHCFYCLFPSQSRFARQLPRKRAEHKTPYAIALRKRAGSTGNGGSLLSPIITAIDCGTVKCQAAGIVAGVFFLD
jgi:hypothetical protein